MKETKFKMKEIKVMKPTKKVIQANKG